MENSKLREFLKKDAVIIASVGFALIMADLCAAPHHVQWQARLITLSTLAIALPISQGVILWAFSANRARQTH
ncbi:hypothetical protein CCAX7_26550 [Capsulimonas corticalis]|uniref:Uncharacterized protein n=1 Tax=Capsulimonas corticalis TaxID=2219043 RepID=A0A402D6M2_9BACT|nr:hypothetical protein [Capsulimonas corticalis]BDI30604.1 hypothetical protein CCAX7_26550 [Capsulimonas corticalis]